MGKLAWKTPKAAADEAAQRFGPRGWALIRGCAETLKRTGTRDG
jgi:hypothetical protein